jgi:hypothetical protein
MTIRVIGLDIAKNVFQVHGEDERGQVVLRRKIRRRDVLRLFASIEPALVGIEALPHGPLLGAGDYRAWTPGSADAAAVRQTLRQKPKERCC